MKFVKQYIMCATVIMSCALVMWGTVTAENRITKIRTGEMWEEVYFSTDRCITDTKGEILLNTDAIKRGGEKVLSLSPPPWNYLYWIGEALWQAVTG